MRLALIVLAHRDPEQLVTLRSALSHPHVHVYLHLDRRVRLDPFTQALSRAGLDENTVLLPRHATRWGGPELVDAAIDGLWHGVRDRCDYFMLISGQDLPLRPVGQILDFAERAGATSYLEYFPLPTPEWRLGGRDRTDFYTYSVLGRRETCIPRGEDVSGLSRRGRLLNQLLRARSAFRPPRRHPAYVRPFGGWQWWNLSRAAVDHTLRFLDDHRDYRRYHDYTLVPDELFFHSILLGTAFARDHEVVNDSLRFFKWGPEGRHPVTLTRSDLPAMLASAKLFARKFDAAVDGAVIAELAEAVTVAERPPA